MIKNGLPICACRADDGIRIYFEHRLGLMDGPYIESPITMKTNKGNYVTKFPAWLRVGCHDCDYRESLRFRASKRWESIEDTKEAIKAIQRVINRESRMASVSERGEFKTTHI